MLLHEAAKPKPDGQRKARVGDARKILPSEPATAVDLARTGLYARNLAATARISEQPQLAELVLAASSTIGPRYAARLFELATAEHVSTPAKTLDALTFEVDPHTRGSDQVEAGLCFRGRRLSAEPWFPVPWPIFDPPDVEQLTRDAHDAEYEKLPDARPREEFHWHAYPPDQEAYEEFVRYALREAGQNDPLDGPSLPFVSGLEGGLDVRTTIRFWHEDQVYVRRHPQRSEIIRNGVIDWTSRAEDSKILRGGGGRGAGWNDPDSTVIGNVSRAVGHETISQQGESVCDAPATRVVVRDARPSHVRRRSGHGRLLESRHRAPSGSPGPWAEGRVRLAGGDFHVLRREAVRLLQPVRAERAHPRAGAIAQSAPPMVPARPPFPCTPGATSVLAPALVERESVEGAACAPLGAPETVANRGALSGGPA